MKQPGTLIGSALVFCATAGFVLSLHALPERDDLSVKVNSSRAFIIEGDHRPLPSILAGPSDLKERIEIRDLPLDTVGGIHLRTWRIDYAHRWEREVTLPILSGPLKEEGTNVCGFTLKIGAGVLTNDGAIEDALQSKLSKLFKDPITDESTGISIEFKPLSKVNLDVVLKQGFATIKISLLFQDSTTIHAAADIKLISSNSALALERIGDVRTAWKGPTFDDLVEQGSAKGAGIVGGGGAVAGFFFGGPIGAVLGGLLGLGAGSAAGKEKAKEEGQKRAQDKIRAELDATLVNLAFGLKKLKQPFAPLPSRPNDKVALSFASDPKISPAGIVVPLCTMLEIGGSKRDPVVTGPINVDSSNVLAAQVESATDGASDLELIADANGINQVLYLLWQSGTLRELGQSSAILDALPESIRALAFNVTGFDPGLPPTVVQSRSAGKGNQLTVVLGDVALGTWDRRRVVGHAVTTVGVEQGDNIDLSARFQQMAVNCVEAVSRPPQLKLTPCLSDLLPAVRETLQEKPLTHRIPSGDILRRLPDFTFEGLKIDLSKLRVNTTSAPATLRFRVDTKIRAVP
jgi:hypothetical protein